MHTRGNAVADRDWGIDRETSLGLSAGDHHYDTKIVGGLDHVSIQPTEADLNPTSNRHGARVRPVQKSRDKDRDKDKDEKKQQTSDTREPRTNDNPSGQADASRPLGFLSNAETLLHGFIENLQSDTNKEENRWRVAHSEWQQAETERHNTQKTWEQTKSSLSHTINKTRKSLIRVVT